MRLRVVRFGVLIASVMGLLVTSTPAEATTVKTVTFQGLATLTACSGLASPGVNGVVPDTTTTTKTGPKGEPEVNTTVHNGNLCDFTLESTDGGCVKESTGKKTGTDNCKIKATGKVTGFCGSSSGTGTAVLENEGPVTGGPSTKTDLVSDFKFSSTGTSLRVSGGNAATNLHGEVSAVPVTGSCTNKTATGFNIAGEIVIKTIT